MTIRLVSRNGGDQLPVTLAELLNWLKRTDTDEDDDLIESCLLAAIDWAERFTGMIMVDSTYELLVDDFPAGPIYLRRGPLLELQSVTYRDSSGVPVVLGTTGYSVAGDGGSIFLPVSTTWPSTDGASSAVQIRWRAGYIEMTGSPSPDGDIPETFKAAIKIYAATLYANREIDEPAALSTRIPWGAEQLLRYHRIDDSLA